MHSGECILTWGEYQAKGYKHWNENGIQVNIPEQTIHVSGEFPTESLTDKIWRTWLEDELVDFLQRGKETRCLNVGQTNSVLT